MRFFEITIFILAGITLILNFPNKYISRKIILFLSLLLLVSIVIHIVFEKTRWQMAPAIILASLLALFALWQNRMPGNRVIKKPHRWMWVITFVVLILSVLPPALFPVPSLPEPTGPYAIGTTSFYWVDESRSETLSPVPGGKREIMVQVWYPAVGYHNAQLAPYMEQWDITGPVLAKQFNLPPFLFDHISLAKTHSYLNAPVLNNDNSYPVLLFSHGWTGVRTQNTYQAENLASHGYIVIAPDHTYGAGIVVFPDGHTILNNPKLLPDDSTSVEEYDRAARMLGQAWIGDLQFVLDQTERLNTGEITSIFKNKLDLSKVGFFGHSTGGGAVVETCYIDSRCKVGLSEDAWMVPYSREMLDKGLTQPFFFMQSETWSTARNTELFNRLYENDRAIEYKMVIDGSKHYDFSDIPLLTPLAPLIGLKGPINGPRGLSIINTYTLAFFDQYLKGIPSPLLEGQSPSYPETVFTRDNLN